MAAENAAAARTSSETTRAVRAEPLTMRCGLTDPQRVGAGAVVSHDRRLAAITDTYGRVAVLDLNRGHIIRLIKGCRDAQCAFVQVFKVPSSLIKNYIVPSLSYNYLYNSGFRSSKLMTKSSNCLQLRTRNVPYFS